jgi:hypothetical protein
MPTEHRTSTGGTMSAIAAVARIRESMGSRPGSRRWKDLSTGEKVALLAVGSVELVLTATAARDLYRRPPALLLGRKAFWWPVIFIQPVGPIAYLVVGRRRYARREDL